MSVNAAMAAMAKATVGGEPPKVERDILPAPEQLPGRVLGFQDKVAETIGAKGVIIADLTKAGGVPSVLRYVGLMRHIRELTDLEHQACLKCANDEYRLLQPEKGTLVVACGFGAALFKRYTKPTKYIYPDDIQALEAKLKDAKKVAQVTGRAKPIPSEFDPEVDSLFSVSVA